MRKVALKSGGKIILISKYYVKRKLDYPCGKKMKLVWHHATTKTQYKLIANLGVE